MRNLRIWSKVDSLDLIDFKEIRRTGEALDFTGGGEVDQIFQADAAPFPVIYARFNGEDLSPGKRVIAPG